MSRRSQQQPEFTPELVLFAYAQGLFPMGRENGRIDWYRADPRALMPLDDRFHVSRSLARTIRRKVFDVRFDTAFDDVMAGCADREETWITPEIRRVYNELHALGLGHCVEAWQDGRLVGGLYGVAAGAAFFAESMFSRQTDASKVCVVAAVERLRSRGFELMDVQWLTPHLKTFGAYEISHRKYLPVLKKAMEKEVTFG
jgi:leucyl/phenylalanyl-tRNA--protein transferase